MGDSEQARLYGPWAPRTPDDAATLLAGFAGLWWVAGGWALTAFGTPDRPHSDLDLGVLRQDVPALRTYLAGRLDLWAAQSGALRPLLPAEGRPLPPGCNNVWTRPSGADPWEYDVLVSPGSPQEWVYRRDHSLRMPMSAALWERDGIRYLQPEIQLLYKAKGLREKDQADFDATLPLLDSSRRARLADALAKAHPDHPWLRSLEGQCRGSQLRHDRDPRQTFDWEAVVNLMDNVQAGVISRRQLREHHARDHDIRRLVRSRSLTPLHPGVYIAHTGTPTWGQRAWAAVLACWPAALGGPSALPKHPEQGPIEVIVDRHRNVTAPAGVVVRHVSRFEDHADWLAYPPRQHLAEAAVDAAQAAEDVHAAFTLLADLVQRNHVRAKALAEAVRNRRRVRDRTLLLGLLDDLDAGACSVLEREYLHRVERRHGLPRGERQRPDSAGGVEVLRDVVYADQGLIVELDGRAFHGSAAARDRDSGRDLAALVERTSTTVRLTYGQVLRTPCTTAAQIAALLRRHGWEGELRRCPDCP